MSREVVERACELMDIRPCQCASTSSVPGKGDELTPPQCAICHRDMALHVPPPLFPSGRGIAAIVPLLPVNFVLVFGAIWVSLVLCAVLLSCCLIHNCHKLQTISYAADREPMTTIYSMGLCLFAPLLVAVFTALFNYLDTKLRLIEHGLISSAVTRTRRQWIKRAMRVGYVLGMIGVMCMWMQGLVPLHVSKPLHNQCGFAFVYFTSVPIAICLWVLYSLRTSELEHRVLKSQAIYLVFLGLLAGMTILQASIAYQHRSFWFNSRILAYCEAFTAIFGVCFPVTFTPLLRTMYIDGSFSPLAVSQWKLCNDR